VLRRIFRFVKKELIGGLAKVENEEFVNLYPLLDIIRVIKLRKMGWVGCVACLGEKDVFMQGFDMRILRWIL
jgi:hypothetical protein